MSQQEDISDADRIAAWTVGEGWCPVTAAVNLLGHKWHPVIIHHLLRHDSLRFKELQTEVGDVTNKVLSESLDDLEEKGLVDRTVTAEKPVQIDYSLTEMGRTLDPVIEAVVEWGDNYLQPALSEADATC